MCSQLNRLKKFLPFQLKRTLVQALLMPHFDYCDILLTNQTTDLSQRLQRVHNDCVRFICNTRKYDHVSSSFEALGWLRLQERRYIHSLALLYSILNTLTPTYLSTRLHLISSYHDLSTRSRHDPILSMPSHRTSQYSSSFTATVSLISYSS